MPPKLSRAAEAKRAAKRRREMELDLERDSDDELASKPATVAQAVPQGPSPISVLPVEVLAVVLGYHYPHGAVLWVARLVRRKWRDGVGYLLELVAGHAFSPTGVWMAADSRKSNRLMLVTAPRMSPDLFRSIHTVDSGTVRFGDDDLSKLLECFSKCPQNFRNLILCNSERLTDASIKPLSVQAPWLETLDLSGCRKLKDESLKHLPSMHGLRILRLANTNVTCAGLEKLWSRFGSLETLNLRNSRLNDAGMDAVGSLPNLQELDISLCKAISDKCLSALFRLSKLKSLQLVCNSQLTDDGLKGLNTLTVLEFVDLGCVYTVGVATVSALAQIKTLKHLSLSRCRSVTDTGAKQLSACTQLTHLDLAESRCITDATLAELGRLQNLHSLNLTQCSITDHGITLLATVPLKMLSLDGCYRLTDACLPGLGCLTELQVLNFSNAYNLSGLGFHHLARLEKLRSIYLSHCFALCDAALIELADAVPWLQSLTLNFVKVTDEGAVHLAAMTGLESLTISNCDISDRTVTALSSLPCLQELNLTGSKQITMEGLSSLAKVNSGKRLKVLNLNSCSPLLNSEELKPLAEKIYGLFGTTLQRNT
jgi:hypothetical protein